MSGVDCIGGPPLFALASSPVPRGYALPGQGDRSPPKQVVVRGLGHIESAPASFGYFPSVESNEGTVPHPTRECVR